MDLIPGPEQIPRRSAWIVGVRATKPRDRPGAERDEPVEPPLVPNPGGRPTDPFGLESPKKPGKRRKRGK